MTSPVDVAVIGAGPYGLSVAAHLRHAGRDVRVFGRTMESWRRHMPAGMKLKSAFDACSLSHPSGAFTLGAYCNETSLRLGDPTVPVPLEDFVAYGEWFQRHAVPDVEDARVTTVRRDGNGFALSLDGGEHLRARSVVVATGIVAFPRVPKVLAELPQELWRHSSAADVMESAAGQDITVVGAGQSALETAALLHEQGATVRLLVRRPDVRWNGEPQATVGALERLRNPQAPLGPGWPNWGFSHLPDVFRRLPAQERSRIAWTALGPAGSWWLRERVDGRVAIHTGVHVVAAAAVPDGVQLTLRHADGHESQLVTGRVIAATGYTPTLDAMPFLDRGITGALRTSGTSPALDRHLQSSVRGLHFVGVHAANSFGPLMRFVAGAGFAARRVAAGVATDRPTGPARVPIPHPRSSDEPTAPTVAPAAPPDEPVPTVAAPPRPVLMYHGIGRVKEDPHHLWVTPERLDRQLSWLGRRGLRGVSVAELCDAAAAGRADNLVAITFDDGYADVLTNALPVLQRHGFNATVFALAGLLGGSNSWDDAPQHRLLDADELRLLQHAGVEIGSHGLTHKPLTGLSAEALAEEVGGSRRILSELLGQAPRSFAYPYGLANPVVAAAVRAAGYEFACAVKQATAGDPWLQLRRAYVGENDRVPRLELKLKLASSR